jgi:uncharacterized OB-fold protein
VTIVNDPTTLIDPASRLLPVDDDLDTGGFFEAARRGELVVRTCNGCEAVLHVPRMYCRHCGSWDGRWQTVDGAATLYSWTVVTHQVHPAYQVPYTVVLVDLDSPPDVRLVGYLPGAPELTAGMPMDVWFEEIGHVDGRAVVLPQWKPAPVLDDA